MYIQLLGYKYMIFWVMSYIYTLVLQILDSVTDCISLTCYS